VADFTEDDIYKIKIAIERSEETLTSIVNTLKTNVNAVSEKIGEISFEGWIDEPSSLTSQLVTSLKNSIITPLQASINEGGSLSRLLVLLDALKKECNTFVTNYGDYQAGVGAVEEKLSAMGTETPRQDQKRVISELLDEIQTLRFDTEVTNTELPHRMIVRQKTEVNQFDVVRVFMDGEFKDMYYLGTDYKGRSYFSETLNNDAPAYYSVWPEALNQKQADIVEHMAEPYMMDGYISYVIFGGNTGNLTKGNVLEKWGNSYANGAAVGDSNFNESIVFEDSEYVPAIVERGGSSYNPDMAYHVIDAAYVSENDSVPLSSVVDSSGNWIDNGKHPNILLKPGEKIYSHYGWILIFGHDEKIGSDDSETLLIWDESQRAYYVYKNMGYYTSQNYSHGEGYDYITEEKLREAWFTVK